MNVCASVDARHIDRTHVFTFSDRFVPRVRGLMQVSLSVEISKLAYISSQQRLADTCALGGVCYVNERRRLVGVYRRCLCLDTDGEDFDFPFLEHSDLA